MQLHVCPGLTPAYREELSGKPCQRGESPRPAQFRYADPQRVPAVGKTGAAVLHFSVEQRDSSVTSTPCWRFSVPVACGPFGQDPPQLEI